MLTTKWRGEQAQSNTQFGVAQTNKVVDRFNDGAGTSPSGDNVVMQVETVRKLNLGSSPSGVKGARVLMTKNLKLPRKRPGAPEYVREFTKLIGELASEKGTGVAYGEVEVRIWNTLLKCDERD